MLDPTRAWGSWKAAFPLDPVRVFPGGVGQYQVRFPHRIDPGVAHVTAVEGDVQVTAIGPSPDYCNLQEFWVYSGPDVIVRNVICFNAIGATAANRFFVTFTSRV